LLSQVLALTLLAADPTSASPATGSSTVTARANLLLAPRPSLASSLNPLIGPDARLCAGGLCGAQLGLGGRLDFGRLVPALSSSFAHWSVGVPGNPRRSLGLALRETTSEKGLLVGSLGYGLYLGRPKTPRSQLFVYYDQELRFNGVGGRPHSLFRDPRRGIGVDSTLLLTPRLGVQSSLRAGKRWFAGLSLVFRP
jgi:hypothetical protein